MAKLQLNKSSLTQKTSDLKNYRQFLPSLDMKRKQLLAELKKAEKEQESLAQRLEELTEGVGDELPMLANDQIGLEGLVTVKGIELGTEKIMGIEVPILDQLQIEEREYSHFSWPHWVDTYVKKMHQALELKIQCQIWEQRLGILRSAVQRATQKVNLFDKVLIPRTEEEIARIQIYLSDLERSGVVTSKIAKRKRSAP